MRAFNDPARKRRQRRLEELEGDKPDSASSRAGGTAGAEPLPEDRIVGVVDGIDEDMATVLVGADEVEYVFPLSLLPDGAAVGMMLYLVVRDGRLEVIGERAAGKAELGGAVQDRLERGLTRRRIGGIGGGDST